MPFLGNANNFETMEECILNCSGPDGQDDDESKEDIFISPVESFSAKLQRLKSSFISRKQVGSLTESPSQGTIQFDEFSISRNFMAEKSI